MAGQTRGATGHMIPHRAPMPRPFDRWDGILLIDKPSGMTSHDVVDRIRRTFRLKKVGHGGTLDPMATGLLVILLGRGTKLSNQIMGADKTYEGTLRLGVTTDSEDCDGVVTSEADPSGVTSEALSAEMRKRVGDQMQTPPMVSAVKKGGVPLYKLARKGQTVEREARLIHVYEFALLGFTPPEATFRLRCTKGTYVRTLCADIGTSLSCGAHLKALRRTVSGSLRIEDAISLEAILNGGVEEAARRVIPMNRFAGGAP